MNAGVIYNIGIETNINDVFKSINESIQRIENNTKKVHDSTKNRSVIY